ncbi:MULTISPECIES: ABC transporter permease [Glycomyces]|uniref:ABC transporter permease subunit n=2 Tax=Glycomyces TaxID=58113 RepID=A0A9X3SWE0_9ACTN|nr:ABC transporter permease subunit [Glycomyces lechevalierae]MDA1383941.1 ABC transporter permease subunit [Glycomyces lechevalierae]MDR7341066.1 putative aldouronate transport system permease protein [Glycomyces lechevalierae]
MATMQSEAPPLTARNPDARTVKRKRSFAQRLRFDWPLLVLALPVVAQLAVFFYWPSAWNVIAFMDYSPHRPFWDNPIVGFAWFERLFADPYFVPALLNTLKFAAAHLLFLFPLSVALALVMHSVVSTKVRSTFQSIVYLPYFFSWVLVVTVFVQVLGADGLVSNWIMGLGGDRLSFTSNPDTFLLLAWMQWAWKDAGWGMIIFLAALASINPSLYEAAAVDGANRWRRMWHVTLPGIRPVIILLLILQIGGILSVGFEQYQLQRNAIGYQATEVLDTYVYYRSVIGTEGASFGTAAGLFKGAIGLILILAANKVAHRLGEQGIYQKS